MPWLNRTRGLRHRNGSQPRHRPLPAADRALLHTLLALADGEKHGYAILKEIARRTGDVRLGAGTVYSFIKRALADGLIVESDDRPDPALDDERRRYYRLTTLGLSVAEAEMARLEGIVKMARARSRAAGISPARSVVAARRFTRVAHTSPYR